MELSSGMFGNSDLGTRPDFCAEHGAFISQGFRLRGADRWSECPVCADIKSQKADEEERRRRDAENNERRLRNLIGRAAIPPRFVGKRFDNYVADSEAQARALSLCREYAESFDERLEAGSSLILCGKPGTGKTHLACAIANHILETHHPMFSRVFDAVRTIKATWGRGADQTETQAIRTFIQPDLLILDEVGMQFGSDAEMLLLFEIINGRYEAMLPTIVLSNLPITELKSFLGDRVMDRLREGGGRYIAFDWESHRGKIL